MTNWGFGMMRLPVLEENNFASIDYEQINIPKVLKDVAKTFETEVYRFTE